MTQNPPWASKVYQSVCAEIRAKAQAHGLPLPIEAQGEECKLGPEYGAGHYGVVYPTTDPQIVFKITTDETEAHFVSLWAGLRAKGVDPRGIVKYYAIFAVESTHRGRPVYVLWREAAEHVGDVESVFCKAGVALGVLPWQKGKAEDPYLCRQYHIFSTYLGDWMGFCRVIREIYLNTKKKADPDSFWVWIALQMKALDTVYEQADELFDKYEDQRRISYQRHAAIDWVKQRLARHPHKFAILVRCAERVAQKMVNTNVAYQVGGAFGEYLDAGILMADVHLGNLGFVAERPDDNDFAPGMPVITDPGHVLILKRELAQSYIEKL